MTITSGLEGIVVADTELSLVDGEAGRLVLRGHSVEALAGEVSFEGVVALFLDGVLPGAARLAVPPPAAAQGRRHGVHARRDG